MKTKSWCLARAALLTTALCMLSASARAANVIDFGGRSIDLDSYLQGYPYGVPYVDLRSGMMFYRKKGTTDQLMMQSFDVASKAKVDLSMGRVISRRDFSRRNWWGAAYSPFTKT